MSFLEVQPLIDFKNMSNSQIIENTIEFVKETLQNAEGGHDWFHIQRVYNNALELSLIHI